MALTHDATPPAGACNTWRVLHGGIGQFSDDPVQDTHFENNRLFPQLEAPTSQDGCGSGCGCH